MNLSKIKEKYKQILQQPEPNSAQSDQQWELAYSRMKNKRRKHILTESQCVNRSSISSSFMTDEQKYLRAKQKLAQTISNLNKKDLQIEELKRQNIKAKEQIKILQDQIASIKQQLVQNEQKIIDQKVAYNCIQKSMENIERCVQSQKLDKQLLKRQIQYYQTQIQFHKKENQQKNQKIEYLSKQMRIVERYKAANNHLKQDINRLRQLLCETQKYKVFASKIQYKHYLGRPCKQYQCWVAQDVVHDLDAFIKKQQSGVSINNKQFIINLSKFINKSIELAKAQAEKKFKKLYSLKIKSKQRKQNHSMNMMQIRQEEMKRSNVLGNSILKSHKNTLNDSKIFTESLYGGLQKSNINHSFNKNRQVCLEILSTFRKGMMQLIESKEIRKKKLLKLVDWVIQGVMSIFPKERCVTNAEFKLENEQIKITI